MDNKITKKRLGQLLSYDLWKIILIIVAGIFFWSLLFTMFGDSLSEGQSLNVYAYNVTVNTDEVYDLLDRERGGKFMSYEIHETKYYNFGTYSSTDTTMGQQFTAWSSVGQLDIFLVSGEKDLEGGSGEDALISLADRYAYTFYGLKSITDDAIDYCIRNGGYTADGTVTSGVAENFFLTRKKKDNFYRHGLITPSQEVERFEKIWYAANKMKGWLEDESLDIWYKAEVVIGRDKDGNETTETLVMGIDLGLLGKLGGNSSTGKKPFELCTYKGKTDESGNTVADGVVLAVFNNKQHQPDLVYESLAFVVSVIERYSDL